MEKAYIILAHKNPKQLLRLVNRLDDSKSAFFIHIDKKEDLNKFQPVFNYSDKVHLVEREFTNWGGLGLVKATLNALQKIEDTKHFDRVILLSGQDYPIKSNAGIDLFFKSATASVFLEHTSIPDFDRWVDTGGMYRVNKSYFGLKGIQRFAAKAMNFSATILPALRRKMPAGIKPYGGSQWWTIDSYAMKYILNYVKNHPGYTDFHKYTFAPDEIYFHTILLNSKDERIIRSITNNNLMYTKWEHTVSAHPMVLQEEDIYEVTVSDNLFARKFEQETATHVLDLIESSIKKQEKKAGEEIEK